ncbi:MAG: hypothetical protein GHCLOJNM_01709 [bacterium]|nr:hypothetical protein [bacterium]
MITASAEATVGEVGMGVVMVADPLTGDDRLGEAKQLFRSLIQSGRREVVLDLSGVRAVTSDLISFLLMCDMECNRRGTHLLVRNVTLELMKAFRFAGLNQVIEFEAL